MSLCVFAPALDSQFPALSQRVNGAPLTYLDNASTTQKPRAVLDEIRNAYEASYANIHRGVHTLSQRATEAYEAVRSDVRDLLHAPSEKEIIFTRGTTESINLVAQTFGRQHVQAGDEVVVSAMEHHSNLVPWQLLCEERGAKLRVLPMTQRGDLMTDLLSSTLGPRTKVVALSQVSNAIGTINPVQSIVKAAHEVGAVVLVDGAQAVAHFEVDVQALDCDFYAFSAHKTYGPSGVGVLWGRQALLESLPPWQLGGDMVLTVEFEKTTFAQVPYRFEAGTPNIAGVIAFGAAIRWLQDIGFGAIERHERALLDELLEGFDARPEIRRIGTPAKQCGVVSFEYQDVHAHDVGSILDHHGVAVRAGHHCAQPAMQHFGVDATVRASLAAYNTSSDIQRLLHALDEVKRILP